ncbi:MAG: GIY-YIG nuclease family protein [Candidatus Komeilibacteria bacterium]
MYYVYLLKLNNGKIYSGCTDDLYTRIQKHQQGKVISTRDLRPLKLIWYCYFPSRVQARRFEKYLKTGSGQAFRNKHLV